MSGKNKNYNSIIFLTTLSVYFGLSLLGAAPQVLAYAATTRNFDVQTEIEVTDDFDNNPERKSRDLEAQTDEAENLFFERCADCLSSFLKSNRSFAAAKINIADTPLEDVFSVFKLEFQQAFDGFKINKTDGNLKFQPEFQGGNPAHPAVGCNSNLNQRPFNPRNTVIKIDYDGKAISSENNQIFIVTRLPRAAIDSLA